jgi:hypothetical protein
VKSPDAALRDVTLPFDRLGVTTVVSPSNQVMVSLSNHDKLMTGLYPGIFEQPVKKTFSAT